MNARERIVEHFEMSQMAKNGVSSYGKIELPKNVIIRTESVEGVPKTTKQAKIRKEGMMPQKPEEGIGKNGRKIAKRAEEPRIIWIEKQAKIREEGMMPPKPEEEIGKNGRKIAKIPEEKTITVMKGSLNSDIAKALDLLEEKIPIYKKLDALYYIEMAVGGMILVSTAIFYQVLGLMAIPMIIFGLGIFFTSFASKRKINRIREEYGI